MHYIRGSFFALTYILILLGSAQARSVITIGETPVLSSGDSQNGNRLLAQSATLPQAATVESLSFYVTTAGGSLIMTPPAPMAGPAHSKPRPTASPP